jgi:hypothetical protein
MIARGVFLPSASLSEFVRGLSSDPGANGAAGCRLPEPTCHLETKPALAPFNQIGRSEAWRPLADTSAWQLFLAAGIFVDKGHPSGNPHECAGRAHRAAAIGSSEKRSTDELAIRIGSIALMGGGHE